MQDTEEIWKDIPGYEGFYQASSLGRIKRLPTTVKHSSGRPIMKRKGGVVKQIYGSRFGYYHIWFCVNGNKVSHRVNVLIAKTFIPNPDGKREVNHIDGIKTNNNISNLEWVSKSENRRHAIGIGLIKNIPSWKLLTKSRIHTLLNLKSIGYNQGDLARIFKLNQSTVSRVLNGKRRYGDVLKEK